MIRSYITSNGVVENTNMKLSKAIVRDVIVVERRYVATWRSTGCLMIAAV